MNLAEAIRLRDSSRLPSRRDEDWRWTDLRSLVRTLPEPSPSLDAARLGPGPFEGICETVVTLANGVGPGAIEVSAGETRTLQLRNVARGEGSHAAHLRITVAAGGRLALLESHEGDGGGLSLLSLEFDLASGASCERLVIADGGVDAVSLVDADVRLGAGAEWAQTLLTNGARRQRLETRVLNPGDGTSVRLDGVYVLAGRSHADLTSSVTHSGPQGQTVQLTRGVVDDQARAVFQGRITVEAGADGTDARMAHNALILSDRAEVDARPELEIYADDVACAHGATVGALDAELLFYMRQRGLPEAEARSLLLASFLGEVIDRIQCSAAAGCMRAWLQGRIGGSTE